MIEPLLLGIVLGLIPVTLAGLFTAAYLQYKRGSQFDFAISLMEGHRCLRGTHNTPNNTTNHGSVIGIVRLCKKSLPSATC